MLELLIIHSIHAEVLLLLVQCICSEDSSMEIRQPSLEDIEMTQISGRLGLS